MQGNKRPLLLPEAGAGELSRPRKKWRTVVLSMREEMRLRDVFGHRETGTVSYRRLLQVQLVSMVKTVVSEELRKALAFLHAPPPPRVIPAEENHPRIRLGFLDKVKQPVYTTFKVERQNSQPGDTGVRVAIYSNNQIITWGSLASAEIEVFILPGEFCKNGRDSWTQDNIENAILVDREKMPPVLQVKRAFKLSMGLATIDWLVFGDNSSWTRDKMFRLGIRILNWGGIRVIEGITEPFPVRDRHMEACQKHNPPVSSDEIWRLKRIRKKGDRCKSLNEKGINTVKDLLDFYYRDEAGLRNILGGISEKNRDWKTIIEHAKTCADYNGALDRSDQLPEIQRNSNTLITCNGSYLHGSASSQHHPLENQTINRNEVFDGVLRQISPFEGYNSGNLLYNEAYQNMVVNTMQHDNEFQAGDNALNNMGFPLQIPTNHDTFPTCNRICHHGSSSSQQHPLENQIIHRNEVFATVSRQIHPSELGYNWGNLLNNEAHHNIIENTMECDNENQAEYNAFSNMGFYQQVFMNEQINAANPIRDQTYFDLPINNNTNSILTREEVLHGSICHQDQFVNSSEALAHMPGWSVPLQTTRGPRTVSSGLSAPNPSENNLINPARTGSQVVIPVGLYPVEDLLADVESGPNYISELPSTSRSSSFGASCGARVEEFIASITSNCDYVKPVSPRMKAKIKVLFKVISFLTSPGKKGRQIVPPANQPLVLGC